MNPHRQSRRGAFTRIEFIVVVAIIALILLALLPALMKPMRRSSRIGCANNLKQVGLSYRLWGGDNGEKYPSQVSTNAGGTMELVASGLVFPVFKVMSNELGTTKIITCPEDTKRKYAADFSTMTDANISYFTVPEADESTPDLWLSGDRNLATNRTPLKPGLFTMPTNRVMSWTSELHNDQGYLVLADGAVVQPTSATLHRYATNALRAHSATTNTSFRLAIP